MLADRTNQIPGRTITEFGFRFEAGITVRHNHIMGIWLNSMMAMFTETEQDMSFYKNACDIAQNPKTYKADDTVKSQKAKDYLTSLFRNYQDSVVIPRLVESGHMIDEVLGSDYYTRLTQKQITFMDRFVDIYPELFTTIKKPMSNPGVRIDRWEGVNPAPYMKRLIAVHKAMLDIATFEHSQALDSAYKLDDQSYQDKLRMLADPTYARSKTPPGLVPIVLPFVDAGLFSYMDRFAYHMRGDGRAGFEGLLPPTYYNQLKNELTLYKKENYHQVLMAIIANPPAKLDLTEKQLERARAKQADIYKALASDGLAPFAEMIVTGMMEASLGKGLGNRPAPREPVAKASRPKSNPKEITTPKSEVPCISSVPALDWKFALNNLDVFLGITPPAFAGCLKEGWSQEFKNNPKYRVLAN